MERKRVQRKDREGEDLKHSFVKRQIEWRSELLIACLLGACAFFGQSAYGDQGTLYG